MFLAVVIQEYTKEPGVAAVAAVPAVRDAEGKITRDARPAIPGTPPVMGKRVRKCYVEDDAAKVIADFSDERRLIQYYKINAEVDSCTLTPVTLVKTDKKEVHEIMGLEAGGEIVAES